VQEVLKRLWRMLDCLCGKRLQQEVREKLLRMGAATIDRLQAGEKKLQRKSRSRTKPGTLLRQQIPVRTFADWDEVRPGFAEIDLVGHDGGSSRGDYVQTLNLTDVATTWAEAAAVRNRARVWVLEALEQLRQQLPFPLLGLDSDNGGEFINGHLLQYCTREELTFTGSRPWGKNDNCFVEQKNYSVVRRYVGYDRYDSEAELQLLNRRYAELRRYVNFFLPSHKLQEKVRRGSRVTKRYDRAQTPYQRVLASAHLPEDLKQRLRRQYESLNPAQLYRNLCHLQEELFRLNARKPSARAVDGAGHKPGYDSLTRGKGLRHFFHEATGFGFHSL